MSLNLRFLILFLDLMIDKVDFSKSIFNNCLGFIKYEIVRPKLINAMIPKIIPITKLNSDIVGASPIKLVTISNALKVANKMKITE